MKVWFGTISKPSDRVILHLQDLATLDRQNYPVIDAAGVRKLLAEHPEVQAVNFYARWMPQRPVAVEQVDDALLGRLFRSRSR